MINRQARSLFYSFQLPVMVVAGIILYLVLLFFNQSLMAVVVILTAILLGTFEMLKETVSSIFKKNFALDYIAILAIAIGILTHEYLVSAILALMVSTGITLENYSVSKAKESLTGLINRIPTDVTLWQNDRPGEKEKLEKIAVGDEIFIRKQEVIPLDGVLLSDRGETDESSLTGEPYFTANIKGDFIRSGTINTGQTMVIKVTRAEKDSTYKKIISMVQKAQEEKSPLVRLADQYSTRFTLITFAIGAFAFISSGFDLDRVLAVLAVATPCPLIIATPIALLGGINASAKQKIIVKKLAALEVLSRAKAIVFDKTGTVTLGNPVISSIEIFDKNYAQKRVMSVAMALERNSLHPLAKALVEKAREEKAEMVPASNIEEIVGVGISGMVGGKKYTLAKSKSPVGMTIELIEGSKKIAEFTFEDRLKEGSKEAVARLKKSGLELYIFTGDKRESAEKITAQLGEGVTLKAECSPEEKTEGINDLRKQGKVTAMVGDGINDAPALALADVGMAFSNQEQTAASEAADIVFLGGDFGLVLEAWRIAKRTIDIAKESIFWGIGLSVAAMIGASVGIIPPLLGAGLQEAIDVAVIFNALRAR